MKFYLNEKSSKEAFEAFINCAIVACAYEDAFDYFIELGLKKAPVLKEIESERPSQKPWQKDRTFFMTRFNTKEEAWKHDNKANVAYLVFR